MSRLAMLRATTAPDRGYTLVECLVACAVAGTLATLAVGGVRHYELKAGRMDAIDALLRIQLAQEQYRALHGMYSAELSPLRGTAAHSPQRRYAMQLQRSSGEHYIATAVAVGEQLRDSDCPALTLAVEQGNAHNGPLARCWNR